MGSFAQEVMGSGEVEFAEEVPQGMICSICMGVLHQPHLVNCCEQHFCKDCLGEWLKSNPSCPHCRATNFTHMLMQQKSRKIGELKVYCPNRKHGCDAVVKSRDCAHHLSADNPQGCLYNTKLDCPNNCNAKVFRCKMAEHMLKFCTRRLVICSHCKLQGEHLKMVLEHVDKCPLRLVGCPMGCGAQLLPAHLPGHRYNCPLA